MSKNKAFYSVHKGHNPGIYNKWDDCQQNIKGFSGAIFKKFDKEEDAKYFLKHGISREINDIINTTKKIKKNGNIINVFTDGDLVRYNNKIYAGYGIYINSEKIKRNISEPLQDQNKTINKAELMGIIKSLRVLKKELQTGTTVNIYTDSQYCVNCTTTTGYKYKMNDFKLKNGTDIPNKKYIETVLKLIDPHNVNIYKVQSHSNIEGNIEADKLAMLGTLKDYFDTNDLDKIDRNEIGKTKIIFGKHEGKTIKELCKNNKNYVKWVLNNEDLRDKYHTLFYRLLYCYKIEKLIN